MEDILASLNNLISLLTAGKYQEIVNQKQNGLLTASEIESAVEEYPGQIDRRFATLEDLNILPYAASDESGIVEFELWYSGEKSDLTITCEFNLKRVPIVVLENVHVL